MEAPPLCIAEEANPSQADFPGVKGMGVRGIFVFIVKIFTKRANSARKHLQNGRKLGTIAAGQTL